MRRYRPVALGIALLAGLVAVPGVSRSAPAEPQGIVGTGLVALAFTPPGGAKIAVNGTVAFEQRDDVARLDLTSLNVTNGATPMNQIAPAGGLTVVIDRRTQRFVVWSAARHAFFVGDLPKPPSPLAAASPTPAPTPMPLPSNAPPKRERSSPFKDIKAFSLGIDMSGHGTTNGHPSTGFAYRLHLESNAGKVNDLTGTLQTADDLAGLPLLFTANAALSSGASGTLRVELTTIEKRTPSKLDFLVPRGYTAVSSPLELVLPQGHPSTP